MKVLYWWTEDGEAEQCEMTKEILTSSVECYHCGKMSYTDEDGYRLTSLEDGEEYVLCGGCAERNLKIV